MVQKLTVHELNKLNKWTKWTRTVVPKMGQKCTRKRPAYDAGKIEEEKTDNRIDPNDIRGNKHTERAGIRFRVNTKKKNNIKIHNYGCTN